MSRMKTRAAGLAAVAVLGGAALVPAAAAANAAPAFSSACVAHTSPLKTCTATVSIGRSRNRIVVTVTNAKGKSTVTIFVHGDVKTKITAADNGKVFFTTHQLKAGTYLVQVSGTSQNKKPFGANVRIKIPASAEPAAKGSATGGTSSNAAFVTPAAVSAPAGGLAFTGAEIGGMSLLGLGLIGGGGTLVVASRRRRAA